MKSSHPSTGTQSHYDSKTKNTAKCAEWIAEGARKVAGVEAKAFALGDVDAEWVKSC